MSGRRTGSAVLARCPLCGARILVEDRACPICGAQVLKRSGPGLGWQLPHAFVGIALTALALAALFWYIGPSLEAAPVSEPTATHTRTPWPTMTYTDTPTITLTATPTSSATPTPYCVEHKVESNESLNIIAEIFGVSEQDLRSRNSLDERDVVQPGRILCIPLAPEAADSLTPLPTRTPTPLVHTVARGDNLSSIAQRYDTTVDLIVEANNLNERDTLSVGVSLIIPRIFDTPTPVPPTETPTVTLVPPTVTPTMTETPTSFKYQPPTLLHPLEGSAFRGPEARITLAWSSVAILEPDEWYMLSIYYLVNGVKHRMVQVALKGTSWRMPAEEYRFQEGFGKIEWTVTVVRETPTGERIALGPPSEAGHFGWY